MSGFELDRVTIFWSRSTFILRSQTTRRLKQKCLLEWTDGERIAVLFLWRLTVSTERHSRNTLARTHCGRAARAGQNLPCWSRLWDASNADLWMIGLSTSISESQSNEQSPDAMKTPVWQESQLWRGETSSAV